MNRLAGLLIFAALVQWGVAPLGARTKKGDKLLEQGRAEEAKQNYEKALELYEQARETDPADAAYRLSVQRTRFQAGQARVDKGLKLRKEGKLEEALDEFHRASALDPSISSAEQEIKRTLEMIQRSKRLQEGGPDVPPDTSQERGLTPTQVARRDSERRSASLMAVPELKPLNNQITNLKMTNQPPKVLYETVGKLAGINVLFDQEYLDQSASKRTTLDLGNTTLEEALDYIALLTKSYWKPLSGNAIFVTMDNVTKRRDYEEHVTRVFYLQNLTTPQELQEALTAVRTLSDVRKVFPYASQNALLVRGTYDQVLLVEKLILDIDKPKAEVVVDVFVMEANKTRTRDLAATIATGGAPGLKLPISFVSPTTTGGATASAGVPLGQIGSLNWNNWAVSMPGFLFQALMSDRQTRVVQSPQLRATDGQKASLRLGDRYPYATGSFQPGVGSVGVSPLVSTQFQFADVGVNVDVTPRIHGSDEVSLQVELEVSAIKEKIDLGGLSQPVIGQRKVNHIIRVKEGEVTLIGGLMNTTENRTRSGVPGLMQIPGIGRFFSSENLENSNADLLVALVPHIVRKQEITADNLRTIATGTDTIWKLNMAPKQPAKPAAVAQPASLPPMQAAPALLPGAPAVEPAQLPAAPPPASATPPPAAFAVPPPAPSAAPGAPVNPWQQLAPQTLPNMPLPNVARPGGASPVPGAPTVPTPAAFPEPHAEAQPGAALPDSSGPAKLVITTSAPEGVLNSIITVNVQVENVKDLYSAPMKLNYDNKVLKLVEISRGGFLEGDGQAVTFTETKVPEPGGAIVTMNRVPGAGGISGSGALLYLKFQAIGKGSTAVTMQEAVLRDSKLQVIPVQAPAATVVVK